MTAPVTVIGDLKPDLVIHLPPDDSSDLSQSVPRLYGGGTAGNVAAGLARLEAPTRLIAAVGVDIFGQSVMAELAADGVDVSRIKLVTDAFTPVVIALIRADGSRLPLVWPPERAADNMLEVGDIDREDITGSCWLHATGMALRHQPASQAVLSAMRTAHAAGVTVSLDLNLRLELWGLDAGMRSIIEEAMAMTEVIFGSGEEELMPLTGEDSVEAAVTKLGAEGRTAVGRVGAAGVVAAVGGRLVAVPAFSTQVVDSLGAGDAFDAGFIAARTRGLEVEDCLAWGNAVAAFNVSGRGARALPNLRQLMALMAQAH